MSKKTLIILTKTFPYDSGEEFLENELSYEANEFDRIMIFPTAINKRR